MTTRHPVDSTYHPCCKAIGGHSQQCGSTAEHTATVRRSLSSHLWMPPCACGWTAPPQITEAAARQAAAKHRGAAGASPVSGLSPTAPAFPAGATDTIEWDSYGTRCVFGPDLLVPGGSSVRAAATQTGAGHISDDPAEERPSALLAAEQQYTPRQARLLAARLVEAADQADMWAAMGRHPAGHRR